MADWLQHTYGAKIGFVEVKADAKAQGFERVSTNDLKASRFELYYLNDPQNPKSSFYRDVQRVYYIPAMEDQDFCASSLVVISKRIDIVKISAEESGPLSNPHWIPVPTSDLPSIFQSARLELQYCKDPKDLHFTFCKGTSTLVQHITPRDRPETSVSSLNKSTSNGASKLHDKQREVSATSDGTPGPTSAFTKKNETEHMPDTTHKDGELARQENATHVPQPPNSLQPLLLSPLLSTSSEQRHSLLPADPPSAAHGSGNLPPCGGLPAQNIERVTVDYPIRLAAPSISKSTSFCSQPTTQKMGMGQIIPTNKAGTATLDHRKQDLSYEQVNRIPENKMASKSAERTRGEPTKPNKHGRLPIRSRQHKVGEKRGRNNWRASEGKSLE